MEKSEKKSEDRKGTKLRCQNCEHEWEYKGQKLDEEGNIKNINDKYVSCPICVYKVNVQIRKVSDLEEKES